MINDGHIWKTLPENIMKETGKVYNITTTYCNTESKSKTISDDLNTAKGDNQEVEWIRSK